MTKFQAREAYYKLPVTASPEEFLSGHGNWGLTEGEGKKALQLAKIAVGASRPMRQRATARSTSGRELARHEKSGTREVIPYTVYRQSPDYLKARGYRSGWNWRHDETGDVGYGYETKASATESAVRHFKTGRK